MLNKILASSRYAILLAVLSSFLASAALLIYGGVKTIKIILDLIQPDFLELSSKEIIFSFIELTDLFLVSTVLFIVAVGLYELFIQDIPDLPGWLVIHSLDDLKGKLINSIVVILAVYFLGAVVNWNEQANLLQLSAAIAMIIAVLTVFQLASARKNGH